MTKIFISYSRNDEIFARKLATELSILKADIWIDVEDIPAGANWSNEIHQALRICDALVLIISPDSMASTNVEDEWQYFLDKGKPVIPLLLREAEIHFQLNRMQWIDFKNQPFGHALVDLHTELLHLGFHLETPPYPSNYEVKSSHGHESIPEPVKAPQRMSLYIGGAVATLVVILLIVAIASGVNISGFTNQPTETATHGLETKIVLDLTRAVGLADLTATYNAVATNIVGAITETQAFELTANAPTNTATSSPTATSTATNTPDAILTAEALRIAEEEATALAQLVIDEQETQDAQGTANAPTNTPQPTATHTATVTPSPTNTATATPSATATVDSEATNEAVIRANQTVEAQIAETAEALIVRIELGRVSIDDALNVRSSPNTSAQIITSVAPGTILEVIGQNEDTSWINVRLPDGQEGWLDANFFDVLGLYPESQIEELAEMLRYIRENGDFEPIEHEFDGVPMVLVPSGCYTMGISDSQIEQLESLNEQLNVDDEKPPQVTCFSFPFWIDKYEVSQAQFAQLDSVAGNDPAFTGDDLPQDSVTWFEAMDHCQARNAILPSEAQWEYAARGPNNLLFPWGQEFELYLNWGDADSTVVIDEHAEGLSWVGAYQMAGNVWEWTISPYLGYPTGADYRLDNEDVQRVLRGGAFVDGFRSNVRTSNRLPSRPSVGERYYGFRCARVENILP